MKRNKQKSEFNQEGSPNRKRGKPNRKPFFRFIKLIVKLFKRPPHIIYTATSPNGSGDLATDTSGKSNNSDALIKSRPGIYISNHSASSGPMTYELYFPKNMRMWGTYEMCGNFKMR